ncbi:glycoside hydrolase family 3 C-terminal domain-containing protein [Eubacteriaceae bacterium ES3]|nr:glycoside hydrolase family 3 C-terminal domain-containing protein [Eubacteriaceae bacterium ES3]
MEDGLVKKIRRAMNLEEMVALCSGKTEWETESFPKYGIEAVQMADGPHGMRVEIISPELGIPEAKPATCFPPAVLSACSWDLQLLEKIGETIGLEARSMEVDLILGPGINIKRSPLCGRNFEYFSEDPFLSGKLGLSFVKGAQSVGVGSTIKHYLANNQETRRMTVDEKIDIRALREIYLKPFELVLKESKPMAIMCSYNSINGKFVSQSHRFLTRILRNEWGFKGIVMSDWGAVYDRVSGVVAGMDLEMPGNGGINDQKIFNRIKDGKLRITILNEMVERLIRFSFEARENRKSYPYVSSIDFRNHHELAKEAAVESIVLLKNQDSILPIKKDKVRKIGVIGSQAFDPRFQGAGSSRVNATHIDSPYERIKHIAGEDFSVFPSQGYINNNVTEQIFLQEQAVELAKNMDLVLLFVGLPDEEESEGFDRTDLKLPQKQYNLLKAVTEIQKNTVVILSNGGIIDCSWENRVKGIVETFLAGQAGGSALAELLFGHTNFSGKLAETIPMKLQDTPAYINFPGLQNEVIYGESIFVGYRYYDYKKINVRFPFGFGLSYTNFSIEKNKIPQLSIKKDDTLQVTCTVKNFGESDGKETIQLYVGKSDTTIIRPVRELKAFKKVFLKSGSTMEVNFDLNISDFSYYSATNQQWEFESGKHEIYIGNSSRNLPVVYAIEIQEEMIPYINQYSYLSDFEKTERGQRILDVLMLGFNEYLGDSLNKNDQFFMTMLKGTPLRKLIEFSKGLFTEKSIEKIINLANSDSSLENLSFDALIENENDKKGFFSQLFGGKDKELTIYSKVKDIVADDDAMEIIRRHFDEVVLNSEYLQMAINLGITFDKAQKLVPDEFFSDEKLYEIEKEFKSLKKK